MKKLLISALIGTTATAGVLLTTFNSDVAGQTLTKLNKIKSVMQEQKDEIGSLQEQIEQLTQSNSEAQSTIDTLTAQVSQANEFVTNIDSQLDLILTEFITPSGKFKSEATIKQPSYLEESKKIEFTAGGSYSTVTIQVKNLIDDSFVSSPTLNKATGGVASTIESGTKYSFTMSNFDKSSHYVELKGDDSVLMTYNK